MPNTREKLMRLLKESLRAMGGFCNDNICKHCKYEKYGDDCGCAIRADHLIANGVTVQEWISVKDRLPTIYDADADNCVLAIHKVSNKRYYHWRSVADNPFDFTYWTRTPQPPKGE